MKRIVLFLTLAAVASWSYGWDFQPNTDPMGGDPSPYVFETKEIDGWLGKHLVYLVVWCNTRHVQIGLDSGTFDNVEYVRGTRTLTTRVKFSGLDAQSIQWYVGDDFDAIYLTRSHSFIGAMQEYENIMVEIDQSFVDEKQYPVFPLHGFAEELAHCP